MVCYDPSEVRMQGFSGESCHEEWILQLFVTVKTGQGIAENPARLAILDFHQGFVRENDQESKDDATYSFQQLPAPGWLDHDITGWFGRTSEFHPDFLR